VLKIQKKSQTNENVDDTQSTWSQPSEYDYHKPTEILWGFSELIPALFNNQANKGLQFKEVLFSQDYCKVRDVYEIGMCTIDQLNDMFPELISKF